MFETQVATFKPKRQDDLRPEAVAMVGITTEWEALWVVTEDDGGSYVGQTVWTPTDRNLTWFGWVPDEDLVQA